MDKIGVKYSRRDLLHTSAAIAKLDARGGVISHHTTETEVLVLDLTFSRPPESCWHSLPGFPRIALVYRSQDLQEKAGFIRAAKYMSGQH